MCIDQLEMALAEHPSYIDALFQMGLAKLMNKQVHEATNYFKQAMEESDEPRI